MGSGIKLSVTFSEKHANLFKPVAHNGHNSRDSLQESGGRQHTNDHSLSSGGDDSLSDNEITPPTNDSDSSWTSTRELELLYLYCDQ